MSLIFCGLLYHPLRFDLALVRATLTHATPATARERFVAVRLRDSLEVLLYEPPGSRHQAFEYAWEYFDEVLSAQLSQQLFDGTSPGEVILLAYDDMHARALTWHLAPGVERRRWIRDDVLGLGQLLPDGSYQERVEQLQIDPALDEDQAAQAQAQQEEPFAPLPVLRQVLGATLDDLTQAQRLIDAGEQIWPARPLIQAKAKPKPKPKPKP